MSGLIGREKHPSGCWRSCTRRTRLFGRRSTDPEEEVIVLHLQSAWSETGLAGMRNGEPFKAPRCPHTAGDARKAARDPTKSGVPSLSWRVLASSNSTRGERHAREAEE